MYPFEPFSHFLYHSPPSCFCPCSISLSIWPPVQYHCTSVLVPLLITVPIQFHLLLMSSVTAVNSALSSTSLLGTCCCHLIVYNRLRHLIWKTSSFLSSPFVNFHVLLMYNETNRTRLLNRITFVLLVMLLVIHTFAGCFICPLARALLFLMSAVISPLLLTFAPT